MARTLVLGGVVFGAVKLAVADPGGPSSPDALTFAGVLRERMGTTGNTLTFLFRRSGGTTSICTSTTRPFSVDSGGAFSVQVPLDGCPNSRTLFDGDTVVYDVRIGSATGDLIASDVAITAVPYARFADQAGVNNDCPAGFGLDRSASPGTVCVRSLRLGGVELRDEVVKVGRGATAFWMDRYESGVYHVATGVQFNAVGGGTRDIEVAGLMPNGRPPVVVGETPLAVSREALPTVNVTWFQANMACRANGKRLPTGDEWLAAGAGTNDDATCNVSGPSPRASNATGGCRSSWGAHDMIGNVWEWTADWFAGAHTDTNHDGLTPSTTPPSWPADSSSLYGNDGTWNIGGAVTTGGPTRAVLPAAGLRGGSYQNGTGAGVFTFSVGDSPTHSTVAIGFRCVIPR